MQTLDVRVAKAHLSAILDQVAAGEEIVITKAGEPAAKLVPLMPQKGLTKRRLGILAGQLIAPSSFDEPLPDDLIDAIEGRFDET